MTEGLDPTTGEWQNGHSPVVVGVDGSKQNQAAIWWASAEAAGTGARLVLLSAVHLGPHLPLAHLEQATVEQRMRGVLDEVAAQVAGTLASERIDREVVDGAADDVLLSGHPEARLVVVGKRGLGTVSRLIVGSTSLAVAGRSHVPVAVVPDSWSEHGHTRQPIVVGVDPYRPHHRVLHLAFRRAERLDVPLVAVHGWETPTAAMMAGAAVDEGIAQWKADARREFDKVVDGWGTHFPHVRLSTVHSDLHPATAILEAAERAQLVILGRHASSRFTGFTFGSVTRAVLHYSVCPVLVVPTDEL